MGAPASLGTCNSKSLAKFPVGAIFSGISRYRPGFHDFLHGSGHLPPNSAVATWLFSAILTRTREKRLASSATQVPLFTLFAQTAQPVLKATNSNNVEGGTLPAEAGRAKIR
jgi:hypothetical protein